MTDRLHAFSAFGVTFKISEIGRQRVIKEHQKNVHAYVVVDKYSTKKSPTVPMKHIDTLDKISYNPYTDAHFMCDGKEISRAEEVVFRNGQCFMVR